MTRGCIALFAHQPRCSVQSINGIMLALSPRYRFKVFTRHPLEQDFFDDVDAVCIPGGIGDSDSWDWLMREHKRRIREFVRDGGAYLGICMGAYWADSDYFDILNQVRVKQYIRSAGTCTRRPHAKHMPITWQGRAEHMYFYDGCTFESQVPLKVVARYSSGAPMAVIQNRIGLIGCHPEAEHHWYQDHSWMRKRWSGTQHHLLVDFVEQLL